MLPRYYEVLQDGNGSVIANATVTVTTANDTAAELFSDRAGATPLASNVVESNSRGEITFCTKPGFYNLAITKEGYSDAERTEVMLPFVPQFHVASYEGLAEAIEDCADSDAPLRWNGEHITVTDNLVDFWSCDHDGRGRITRGSDTFYINPRRANVNRIYINAATGSDLADGLTALNPFATLQAAANAVAEAGMIGNGGRWEFVLAASNQTGGVTFPSLTRPRYPITIKGASVGGFPNVPTTKLVAPLTTSTILTLAEGRDWFFIDDIEFKGASGSGGTALNLNGGVRCRLTNVHTDGTCQNGVIVQHGAHCDFVSGILRGPGKADNDSRGFLSIYNATHAFVGTSSANGVQILEWDTGVQVSEGANGHLDGIVYRDNVDGLIVRRGAGACNVRYSTWERNTTGILAEQEFYLSNPTWGSGADANTVRIKRRGNAPEFDFNTQDHAVRTPRLIESTYTTAAHTGTVDNTQVWEFADIRDWMIGEAGDDVGLEVMLTKTGSANTCAARLYLYDGSTEDLVAAVTIPAAAGDHRLFASVHFSNANAQRGQMWLSTGTTGGYNTGALNMTGLAGALRLKLQLADAADSISMPLIKLSGTIGG